MPAAAANGGSNRSSARLHSGEAPATPARTHALQPSASTGSNLTSRHDGDDSDGSDPAGDGPFGLGEDAESEESEIDLSPLPAERRASVLARLSASPIKLGRSIFSPPDTTHADAAMPTVEDEEVAEEKVAMVQGTDGEDSDDEDGPPVEESMTQGRSKALDMRQRQAEARKGQSLKRKRVAEAQASRHAANAATKAQAPAGSRSVDIGEQNDADDEAARTILPSEQEGPAQSDHAPAPAKRGRLDPALFAQAFAPKSANGRHAGAGASSPGEGRTTRLNAAQQRRHTRASTSKLNGIFKGRDGLPMARLQDGRTTVRSLQGKSTNTSLQEDEDAVPLTQPDTHLSAPNAKSRAFKKKVLGLRASDIDGAAKGTKAAANGKKGKENGKKEPERTDDDPLGLEDPLFMGKVKKGKDKVRNSTTTGRPARGAERGSSGASGARRAGHRGEGGRRAASTSAFAGRSAGEATRLFRRS